MNYLYMLSVNSSPEFKYTGDLMLKKVHLPLESHSSLLEYTTFTK